MRSSTATEQSTIIVEKRDERGDLIEISPVKSVQYVKQSSRHSFSSNSNDILIFQQIQQKGPVIVDFTQAKLDTPTKSAPTPTQAAPAPLPNGTAQPQPKTTNENSQQVAIETAQTFQQPKQPDVNKPQSSLTPNNANKKPVNASNLKPQKPQQSQITNTTTPTTQPAANKALKRPQTLQTPINLNNTRLTQAQPTPVPAPNQPEEAPSEPKRPRFASQPCYDLPTIKFAQKNSTKIVKTKIIFI